MLAKVVQCISHKGSCCRVIRFYAYSQFWLKVERPLLHRKEWLEYALIERDLNVTAKCHGNVGIVCQLQCLPVVRNSDHKPRSSRFRSGITVQPKCPYQCHCDLNSTSCDSWIKCCCICTHHPRRRKVPVTQVRA